MTSTKLSRVIFAGTSTGRELQFTCKRDEEIAPQDSCPLQPQDFCFWNSPAEMDVASEDYNLSSCMLQSLESEVILM